MQFDAEGLIVRRVRWFFAAPDAKPLPFATAFSSANWGTLSGVPGKPGEVWDADRPWRNGAPVKGLDGVGPPCGTAAQFLEGVPSDTVTPPYLNFPPCCGKNPVPQGSVGIKAGLSHCLPGFPFTPNVDPVLAFSPDGPWIEPYFSMLGSVSFSLPDPPAGAHLGWLVPDCNILHPTYVIHYNNLDGRLFHGTKYLGRYAPHPTIGVFQGSDPFTLSGYFLYYIDFFRIVERGSLGIKAGISSIDATPVLSGTVGSKIGLDYIYSLSYHGLLGIESGIDSTITMSSEDEIGFEAGVVSVELIVLASEIGFQGGVVSIDRQSLTGEIGFQGGVVSIDRQSVTGEIGFQGGVVSIDSQSLTGEIGFQGGVVSIDSQRLTGAIGFEGGVVSTDSQRLTGAIGFKGGVASSHVSGLVFACCPKIAIPTTLNIIGSGGGSGTCTYSSGAGGYPWSDPDSALTGTLKCVTVSMVSTWTLTFGILHCTGTSTVLSLSCAHPFSVKLRAVVSGVTCPVAGTYDLTFHE